MDEERWIGTHSSEDELTVTTTKRKYKIDKIKVPVYYMKSLGECIVRVFNDDDILYKKLEKFGALLKRVE